jgi:hypothetical protein
LLAPSNLERTHLSLLPRLRRTLLVVCTFAAVWAIVVRSTGGFALYLAGTRLSSRRPGPAALLALLSGVAAWMLSPPSERRAALRQAPALALRLLERLNDMPASFAPILVLLTSAIVVGLGVTKGAVAAGGSDSYGYVSQAHLWATGTLRIAQPIAREMNWPFAMEALAPLGYRPAPQGTDIVPIYAPGLPIVMALFERLGGRKAVFLVVPLLGGVAVWATYLMGRRLAGPAVGVSAAILLATSPVFLFQVMFPMSDVPVAAWWALVLALVLIDRRWAAALAGVVAGLAILTRPNLVFLLMMPGVLLVSHAVRERSLVGPAAQRLWLFAAGIVPACLAVALINTSWYGSPLSSGYGPLDTLYRWENLGPNLRRYPRWLIESQTPVVILALAAPFLLPIRQREASAGPSPRRIAAVWLAFAAAVFGCYVFYMPFDAWWYLRFLLPAFPALFVLISVTLVGVVARLVPRVHAVASAVLVALLGWHGVSYASRGVFHLGEGEQKYAAVGEYISRRLPGRAALICMQHSGSVRYYSGRLTVRYDWIPPSRLDTVLTDLRRLGYQPYFLLEGWEEQAFRERFSENRLGALDWPPIARLDHPSAVRIYDPTDGLAATRRERPTEVFR